MDRPLPASHRSATPAPLRTIVTIDLANFDEVRAAGGHPHCVFPTTFDELVRITGGTPADVGA
jgi:prolyl-tRNA editing enzyme YbaK/EbsC (Cys-tRNA(Pro) deacylase)